MGGSSHDSGLQGADLETHGDVEGSLHIDPGRQGPKNPFFLRTLLGRGSRNIASRLDYGFDHTDPICGRSSGHSLSRGEEGASLKNQWQMLGTSQSLAPGANHMSLR